MYDENLHAWEDWDLNLRCSNGGYLFHHTCIKDGSTLIRLHDNSMMGDPNNMRINFVKFNEKHKVREIPGKFDKMKRVIKTFAPRFIIKAIKSAI
jgi:hypothetical protein